MFGIDLSVARSPTWCPARPIRCSPRLTAPGDSTWTTRSTAPMSIPSSSELVATMPGVSLFQIVLDLEASFFRQRSVMCRDSVLRAPSRCATAAVPSTRRSRLSASWSSHISFRRPASRSASRREFTKTIVDDVLGSVREFGGAPMARCCGAGAIGRRVGSG